MPIGRLIKKAAIAPAHVPNKKLCSAYHSAAENIEATAPQIATQIPSDRNDTTIKATRSSME
jgi:hypothetical protein